jgi:DNA-binding response OmpR family regulator
MSIGKKRILAVDDEPEVLGLLKKRLESSGYEVLTASNGREALSIALDQKPDLIVLDILMPEMDGSETAAALRENVLTKDIPILFLTCLFTKREERLGGHEVGPHYFLAKPYEAQELLAEVTRIISHKHS